MRVIIVCHLPDCPRYRKEMKCVGESATAWHFKCVTCENPRIVTKDKFGGTMGAGQNKDNGCSNAVGIGADFHGR